MYVLARSGKQTMFYFLLVTSLKIFFPKLQKILTPFDFLVTEFINNLKVN